MLCRELEKKRKECYSNRVGAAEGLNFIHTMRDVCRDVPFGSLRFGCEFGYELDMKDIAMADNTGFQQRDIAAGRTTERIIAFYLPQYYPTGINNSNYGEGFTEWTNVGKARRLFPGHYQPRVPADLGYYDLRLSEVREAQAELAREAGVEGFCYYHYWFSEDHVELDLVFNEVLRLKKPDFPFCLCWANQSWYSKFWNADAACRPRLVAEQLYDDSAGIEKHFYSLLPAFEDKRYIRVNGKLLFMIYRPLDFPDVGKFMEQWQNHARKNSLGGFHFVGQATNDSTAERILALGFDGVNILRKNAYTKRPYWKGVKFCQRLLGMPFHADYRKVFKYFFDEKGMEAVDPRVYPSLLPNWDHSPRSGKRGSILTHSDPASFKAHALHVLNGCRNKAPETNLIFLKSWNEWGEGNYMEPDLRYGKGFINALREAVDRQEESAADKTALK